MKNIDEFELFLESEAPFCQDANLSLKLGLTKTQISSKFFFFFYGRNEFIQGKLLLPSTFSQFRENEKNW